MFRLLGIVNKVFRMQWPSPESIYTPRGSVDTYTSDEGGASPQLAPTPDPRPPVAAATVAL